MPAEINPTIDISSAAQETAPGTATPAVPAPDKQQDGKFKLEKIDAENVRKIDSRTDTTVIHIPALEQHKAELEDQMRKMQVQLDQINEVLAEYKKLP